MSPSENALLPALDFILRLLTTSLCVIFPFIASSEYSRLQPPDRRSLLGLIAMALVAILVVLGLLLFTANPSWYRQPLALFAVSSSLQVLIYFWTSNNARRRAQMYTASGLIWSLTLVMLSLGLMMLEILNG